MKLQYVGDAPFFSALSEEEQARVSQRMHLEHRRSGEILFRKGDPSNALYLIKSGWVRLLANGGTVLASQGPGSLVGETDVFLDQSRSIGASAATDVEVWAFSRDDLVGMITDDPRIGLKLSLAFGQRLALLDQYIIEQRLEPLPFFSKLDEESLRAVARRLVPAERDEGTFIVESGQPSEALFIVEEGELYLHSSEEGGDFSELSAGESFGELAVLTGKPHSRSVQAASNTILWLLSASDFDELTEEHPQIRLALSQSIRESLLPEDQARAVERLSSMPLFEDLSEEVLWSVADRLLLLHVPAGETVFAQGASGDALYIVDSGQIEIISDDEEVGRTVLARLGADEFFGEMSLLTGKPRSMGVRTISHTNLWALYRADFDDLINRHPSISMALSKTLSERLASLDKRFTETHLRGLKLLTGLSPSQLEDVSRRLKPVRYRQREVVIHQDTPGHEMYFIESGRVRVSRDAGKGAVVLDEMGAGDLFGEMALLTGSLRSATITAISDVNLWVMSQADFEELVTIYPNLALALSRLLSERLLNTDQRFLKQPASAPPSRRERQPASRPRPAQAPRRVAPAAATVSAAGARPVPQPSRPPVRKTPSQQRPGFGDEILNAFDGLAAWFGGLSMWGKVRLVIIALVLAWLFFIAAPSLVISTLAADDVTNLHGAIAWVQTSTPVPMESAPSADAAAPEAASVVSAAPGDPEGDEEGIRAMAMQAQGAGAELPAVVEEIADTEAGVSSEDATVIEEPVDAAAVAQPQVLPTDTPWIIVVTNTPPPPTDTPVPTDTPLPPTPTPTPTRRTESDQRTNPTPKPTATPAERPQPPRTLDSRLGAINVTFTPAGVRPNQSYWRLVEMRWADEQEAGGGHSIFVNIVDENGDRLVGDSVEIRWEGGSLTVPTEDKPANEYGANFPMYNTLGSYSVRVSGLPSDVAIGLGLGTPQTPNFKVHTCFYLTFQRTMR